VGSTVDDVECGARKDEGGLDTSEIGKVLVEGDTLLSSTRLRNCDGNAEDGVCAEFALVRCAVKFDQEVVDLLLLGDGNSRFDKGRGDNVVDVRDRLGDTFAQVGIFIAITELNGFVDTSRCTRGNGSTETPFCRGDINLYGRVATRVEDLPSMLNQPMSSDPVRVLFITWRA